MRISVICACKNRSRAIKIALSSWIQEPRIDEFIIVDWSSDVSIYDVTKLDSRIKVVRVDDQQWFNQPQPLNLAASLVSGDTILKLDTDFILNPYFDFISKYQISPGTFVSGDHDYLEDSAINHNPYFKFLRGLLWVETSVFKEIGGYNENMGAFYSWEDNEIDIRLRLYGLKHRKVEYDHHLIHMPHPDSQRLKHFKATGDGTLTLIRNNLEPFYHGEELEWQIDYVETIRHVQENKAQFANPTSYKVKPVALWTVKEESPRYYVAKIQ